VSGVDELELAGPEAIEVIAPTQALETSAAPDATIAAFAATEQLESLNASITGTPAVQTPITETAEAPADAEPAAIALSDAGQASLANEAVVAGAPLSDVAEVEPEPAFVPDLAFALGRPDEEDAGDMIAGVHETAVIATQEPQLTLAAAEPEFTPDLSGMVLDGHGYDALEAGRPMAIEAPASDVLAHADLAELEPEFVPDLSAVALDGSAAGAATASPASREDDGGVADVAPAVQGEPAFVPDMSFAVDMTGARGAQLEHDGSTSAQVVAISQPRPAVRALERFLRQVEARRLQLAQGSVA
jgi:hypothetical protein